MSAAVKTLIAESSAGKNRSQASHLRDQNYRPDIDGLRALAIVPVVMFHAFPTIAPGGFVGVDIFFVISGFLISRIILVGLDHQTFSFIGFYANRVRRLFPALLFVLIACLVFGWFFLLPDEYTQLGKHVLGAAAYVQNFVLFREAGYFDIASSAKPLMHLWSLAVEEQFYLTYPLFLWLLWRFRKNLGMILLLLALASFALNIWEVRRDPVAAFFWPQTRIWELAAGGAIASWQLLKGKYVRLSVGNVFSVLGVLLVGASVFFVHENYAFPGWWALLPVTGAAFLILAGPDAHINRVVLASKPAVLVGLISYPLYLWHWPILTFPRVIHGSELSPQTKSIGILISFMLAWATWRYVERPIRFGRKTWTKTTALVGLSGMIGLMGFITYHKDGFVSRIPDLPGDFDPGAQEVLSTAPCRHMVGLPAIDFCRSTSSRTPDVLLIGDSHAGSLYAGLAGGYEQYSQTLMNLGQGGCVPFYNTESYWPGEFTWTGGHQDVACKSVVNRVLDFAVSSTAVRTIILSLRGPLNMSGRSFLASNSGRVVKQILWEDAPRNSSQAEMFQGAFTNTVSRLSASGKDVILFVDWPELSFDPRSCLQRPVSLFSGPRPFCGVPRTAVEDRNRAYREVIFQLRVKFPGLKVFDPLPYLCDSAACYALNDGRLLYRDDNHLSAAGAKYLSQKFFEEQRSHVEPSHPR